MPYKGQVNCSPGTCIREDTRCRVQNRHRFDPRTNRLLLRGPLDNHQKSRSSRRVSPFIVLSFLYMSNTYLVGWLRKAVTGIGETDSRSTKAFTRSQSDSLAARASYSSMPCQRLLRLNCSSTPTLYRWRWLRAPSPWRGLIWRKRCGILHVWRCDFFWANVFADHQCPRSYPSHRRTPHSCRTHEIAIWLQVRQVLHRPG